ncbi:delta(1)-pyrroline-2-carboxylate reductase family protein [Roseomonas sp. E05]|uniref:delta(1)-pyrroline-2-carboxylate reductase family protein n=1 Tax=Roseomonas sp. E05 TaxID=3046310 RepID=UPI0024BB6D7D|nr:delta(1)-pyrroline-2-carboxylate reductase family protein [Roseomonas sp. E05]MDJ0389712.1 delta(1)-pyrroline-2-carboxylate reductase family protein [Roseomonas sp. E05]
MQIHDAAETARLLAYPRLIAALEEVLPAYQRGEIVSPERLVVPVGGGAGMLLSMPCSAPDLIAHKLITIYNGNPSAGLPALQGQVTCLDATNGRALFVLDGPTVTARRTAAISMLGIQRLRPAPPRAALLIGIGAQARAHAEALLELFPGVRIAVQGRRAEAVRAFCDALGGAVHPAGNDAAASTEVVIAATSSRQPVYDAPARADCLVIGVGAYRLDMVEIGAPTITGSQIYVDDPVGAPVEAGDVAAAGTDWASVRPLATALDTPPDFSRPVFLKSVGCAAWDLAACRAAQAAWGG